jgi:FixJ family two-component response regulator
MSRRSAKVFVVDDDVTVCVALSRLIRTAGFNVETFGSAAECLTADRLIDADCLVLDVHLPDLSGLELQTHLAEMGFELPIVFITGRGDIPMSVRAMKAGALEFLTKPFDDEELLAAIDQGIARSRCAKQHDEELLGLQRRYQMLTRRQREVFALVVRGFLNKQIAGELGTAERTVKIHRAHVMRKMEAASLADLVRMADKLVLTLPEGPRGALSPTSDSRANREGLS